MLQACSRQIAGSQGDEGRERVISFQQQISPCMMLAKRARSNSPRHLQELTAKSKFDARDEHSVIHAASQGLAPTFANLRNEPG